MPRALTQIAQRARPLAGRLTRTGSTSVDMARRPSRVGLAPARRHEEFTGVIERVHARGREEGVPTFYAHVRGAGGADLALVWLGRHQIAGLVPGVRLRARGLVTTRKGVNTIFNPTYDLLPERPSR